MSTVFVSWSLLYYFYIYVLVNEVANFFRVDMMPPIEEEDPLWVLEPSFSFPFRAAVLALSWSMGWVTSSSIAASLEETNASIMDVASDLALYLGMSTVFVSRSLLYCFYIYALVNEVSNFFRVDMMPPIEEEDPLWVLEPSFSFPFRATVFVLSWPMGWITSSSIAASLEETNVSIMDVASDLALYLGWCLTAFHQCGVGETLDQRWSGEALTNSSGVRGACKTEMFKRSTHICKSWFQL
jgi:hypothetical protein